MDLQQRATLATGARIMTPTLRVFDNHTSSATAVMQRATAPSRPGRTWEPIASRPDGAPTIAVAMIVRNEAAVLERCLRSVAGHIDEMVLVDTGSTDETKAIAAQFTDRTVDYPWHDDFAAARQVAFDLVTADWVIWLDADETLEGAEHLRGIAQSVGAAAIIRWRTVMVDDKGQQPMVYWRERLVPTALGCQWRGRVHETLVPPEGVEVTHHQIMEVRCRHQRDAAAERCSDRNLRILQAEVAAADQAGVAPTSRQLFYLAREYVDTGDQQQAILTFERYLSVATWADERYQALVQLGNLHRDRGMYDFAFTKYAEAIRLFPTWPLAHFAIASIHYFLQEWEKVVYWIESGWRLPPPETPLFVSQRALTHDWIIHYTNALWNVGRREDALWWTQFALGNDPDDQWHRANLTFFQSHLPPDHQRSLMPPTLVAT